MSPDMPAHTLYVLLQGPPEEADDVIGLLWTHGISAERDERGPNLVGAWFDCPTWPPTADFECDRFSRVTEAVASTRYIATEWGHNVSSALTSHVAMHAETGEALGFILNGERSLPSQMPALREFMELRGLSASDIKWVDAADWTPPQQ